MDETKNRLEHIDFVGFQSFKPGSNCENIDFHIESGLLYPDCNLVHSWIDAALVGKQMTRNLSIYYLKSNNMQECNYALRQKNLPTDVLSIPTMSVMRSFYLGDILVCPASLSYSDDWHWCYMLVHSVLHLLDFEHDTDYGAELMHAEELLVLQKLGYGDPTKRS